MLDAHQVGCPAQGILHHPYVRVEKGFRVGVVLSWPRAWRLFGPPPVSRGGERMAGRQLAHGCEDDTIRAQSIVEKVDADVALGAEQGAPPLVPHDGGIVAE